MHVFGARLAPSRWLKAPLPYGDFSLRIATARNTEISVRPQQMTWLKTEVFIHTATHAVFMHGLQRHINSTVLNITLQITTKIYCQYLRLCGGTQLVEALRYSRNVIALWTWGQLSF
jgi:hypothetical protein